MPESRFHSSLECCIRWLIASYFYPIFSGLAALMSADIAQNLWSLVRSCLNSYCTFHLFPFFSNLLLSVLNLTCQLHFYCPISYDGSIYICNSSMGHSDSGYLLSLRWLLTWYFYPIFLGLAALVSAEIAQNLWSLVCSCLNSYCTFHLFPFFFQICCFLYWI